jgi:hypothetical protein
VGPCSRVRVSLLHKHLCSDKRMQAKVLLLKLHRATIPPTTHSCWRRSKGLSDEEQLAAIVSLTGVRLAGLVVVMDTEAGAVQLEQQAVAMAQVRRPRAKHVQRRQAHVGHCCACGTVWLLPSEHTASWAGAGGSTAACRV